MARTLRASSAHWKLSGGSHDAREEILALRRQAGPDRAGIAAARTGLLADLIDAFDDPARCYLAQPHPGERPRFSDYAQLARVAEWAAADDAP